MTRESVQNGFTLLELLTALAVLGLIIAGLSAGTALGLRSLTGQAHILARHQDLQPVDRLLRQMVQNMTLPTNDRLPGLVGERAGFICLTTLPARDGTAQRVDAALATDGAHRLVLRWAGHIHAERLSPRPAPAEDVLVEGVDHVDVSYLSPDRTGWLSGWERADLPALIRMRLVFPAGDARRWPPIIAQTAQQSRPRERPSG